MRVYKIYDTHTKQYCRAGLVRTNKNGKTWSSLGDAKNAIVYQGEGGSGSLQIHEFETTFIRAIVYNWPKGSSK